MNISLRLQNSVNDTWESFCGYPKPTAPPSSDLVYCPPTTDIFLCWNYTLAGSIAKQFCPRKLQFLAQSNAYKECTENGTWYKKPGAEKEWTNFKECLPAKVYHYYIYMVGYSLSIAALLLALTILLSFKRLRCDRIRLHENLFTCHLLNASSSIAFYLVNGRESFPLAFCRTLFTVATFFGVATYFWMLAEGLYLLAVLIFTFQRGNTLLIVCTSIGWGVPLLLTFIFTAARFVFENASQSCDLNAGSSVMYILLVPILISILANVVSMIVILAMLVEKMRQPNSANNDNHNWWKAAKAILIMTPLLGLYYLLLLIRPADHSPLLKVHEYICAVAVAFQGLIVTMPFCFCNREVQEAVRHWWNKQQHRLHLPLGSGTVGAALLGHSSQHTRAQFQPTRRPRRSRFSNTEATVVPVLEDKDSLLAPSPPYPTEGHPMSPIGLV